MELVGGEGNPAKEAIEVALNNGKHVVTANKALMAKHGHQLAKLAENNGLSLKFEAAVAGGIPAIKTLTESLAGNKINRLMGVMNGTFFFFWIDETATFCCAALTFCVPGTEDLADTPQRSANPGPSAQRQRHRQSASPCRSHTQHPG